MNRTRSTILLALFAAIPLCGNAQRANVNVLYNDGSNHATPRESIERIVIEAEKVTVVTKNGGSEAHNKSDISLIVFDDKSATRIGKAATVQARLIATADGISVTGADDGTVMSLYDAAGRLAATATVKGGTAHISTCGMATGTYIVRAGQTTAKITINR